MDHLPGLLPERAPRRLRLCRLDDAPRRAPAGVPARRAPRRLARLPADHRLELLEAAGQRRADPAHPASLVRHDRPALFPAFDDDAAAPGMVLAPLPERR